ncbi:MAG: UDP-3-O-(3-hydroxymyristoyl)glucosamine N-acyltransferase [Candidatus Acididesulfobacter guangdongensis]|uniref:UDP-3-O-acylglucosamine N-acyltransferase n=1 Tax=Acididesulfobacter guangdongensis TaxID=2597225 RepID=A0A519BI37_ACIG2|nr:MAG: UDP-3-O-(3-hydroxymyristoyl)glucosamine N-acyltransferase [Candidatus Acididesulfobacter guangdongensis]
MSYSIAEIAKLLSLNIIGKENFADYKIKNINSLKDANGDEISFIADRKYIKYLNTTNAAAVIMDFSLLKDELPTNLKFAILDTKNPYLAFARMTQLFYSADNVESSNGFVLDNDFIDKTALIGEGTVIYPNVYIEKASRIGENCKILPGVFIGQNVIIGDNVTIYPNVTVYSKSIIGNNCIIHAGSVIGSDGFGYAKDGKEYVKIIHLGNTILEDDVEIGASTSIDRGAIGSTIIKKGTKIDNLVQIAHNVSIGENCALASQTGIAGSAVIGNNVIMGGQVGVAGHLTVGDNVIIAAQSGISHDIKDNEVVAGSPAIPIKEWRVSMVLFKKLPELFNKIKKI